ncbi:peptide deformylase [Alcanivorax hongdengensis A-11-3]|uniref:Peptide deformylase n=1 Tax=Alcanivorax hongdengensis A-11-3 TaxID=1177179 RepID=L0WDQ6_9GAMM|nr:DNA-processing protein DprA [Alcanivorax hongdengensis]EKF74302.1 peptide deformylase [Alcanivorax hongdengensis A-11-3]
MDGQFRRLLLQALFCPASAALGRALQHLDVNARLDDFLPFLPVGLRERAALLDNTGELPLYFDTLREAGWRWVALGDVDYPPLLASLPEAPGVLAVRGPVSVLSRPALAMVGARNASADGLDNSHRFARALARSGFVIVSGLALGVDAAAHRGAMAGGQTLAVMGCGPDRIYPARHSLLAEQIVEGGGALITEFAPGAGPARQHFPLRNRIISGLSLATIVVEAAIKSGSLITARTALSQGREVFAVPGAIHNPLSKGCHQLLRDGASWLESLDDVFEAFGEFRRSVEASELAAPAPTLIRHLTSGLNDLDSLQQRSGLPMAELAGQLSQLELDGWVEKVAGGYLKRSGGGA